MLYTLLILSIVINLAVLFLDSFPYLYPKVKSKFFRDKTISDINHDTEDLILKYSTSIISLKKTVMPWNEPKGFTRSLTTMNQINHTKEFQIYNYPKAFFFHGYLQYIISNEMNKELIYFKDIFDKIIGFKITRIDQVPFGLVSISLYNKYKEIKYIELADRLYMYIKNSIETEDIVSYRKGSTLVLNDMLGMVVPFLVEYSKTKQQKEPLEIAVKQISYFVKYGVDKETHLPTHGINVKNRVKVGPTNWGRGIGWYFIALSHIYKETGKFEYEHNGLIETLKKIRIDDNLWSQFPGSNDRFDASTTTMILYSIALNNPDKYTRYDIIKTLKSHINKKGAIMDTSGDTYAVNHYSQIFGYSELSQGMLLMLLSILD